MLERILSSFDNGLILRLLKENIRKRASWYSISIFSMLLVALMTSLSAWIMRDVVNEIIVSKDLSKVFAIAIAVAAIFTVKGLASFTQGYYLSRAGNAIVAEQQRRIYDHLLKQGVSYFQDMSSSDLLIRVTHNAQAARNVIQTVIISFVRDLFTLIGLITVMIIQQPTFSLISIAVVPVALFGLRVLLKRVRHFVQMELLSLAKIVQITQETAIGIRVVKAFSLEIMMREHMREAVEGVERRANGVAWLTAATSPITDTLSGLAIAGAIAAFGILVIEQGQTPGEMMSFLTALLLAYEPAKRLARMRVSIEAGMTGVRLMFELLDHPIAVTELPDAEPLPEGPCRISMKGVCFSYRPDQPVLHNINVELPPGKMTALVGPSGSGKSTIINLIMRLYDPDDGSVEINGMDIRKAAFISLRERMSYVGQDTFLFAGSIRQNIGLGNSDAREEEVIAAAKAANAHDFIMEFADGYETDVGENGGNLSGGQKQRIAIARAMLRDSQILILDEATSALDSESEHLIRGALKRLTEGRTTIVIAHRLSTIQNADNIIVIDGGRITERGSQSELLARDSAYRKLYNMQFRTNANSCV